MCIKLHLERYFGFENKVIHDVGSLWNKKNDCNNFEVASNQIYDLSWMNVDISSWNIYLLKIINDWLIGHNSAIKRSKKF